MSGTEEPLIPEKYRPNWYPPWSPRCWTGMRMSDYWQLLRDNRWQIGVARYPMAFLVGACAGINSLIAAIHNPLYRKAINETEIKEPPVFIIGHWRSGTTLVHELLSLDPQFAFPNNFEAFVPSHFLVSRPIFQPLINLLIPSTRPMDRMPMRIELPQEDDFALAALGAPTPYRRIAFPNRLSDQLELDVENLTAKQQEELRQSLDFFYRALTYRYKKRLVLKSPPHTGRVAKLAEWFPGAKFVHLSRHPHQLVPSTMKLWRTLHEVQGFQLPKYDPERLLEVVETNKDILYGAYLRDRQGIPKDRLMEIKFEDLVADPLSQMQQVYEQLQLGPFEAVADGIQAYFERRGDHQRNPNRLSKPLLKRINERWKDYMGWFNYPLEAVNHQPDSVVDRSA